MSVRTIQRRKKRGPAKPLSQEQSGRTWKFAEILTKATAVLGTQQEAEQWLERPAIGLARISHTRCGLRRFKKPTGQEPRAARCGTSGKRGDAPCRLLQPALWVAFRRASPASGGSTVCPDTLFAARCCICLAERATQAAWSVRNAG